MKAGIGQIQDLLDAFLAQAEGASYRCVQEPYAAFLGAMAPTPAELEFQRAHPPASPLFTLILLGNWDQAAWGRTLASLAAQTYPRFNMTRKASPLQGDYILHLWPGDALGPDALYRFALACAQGADLIYCDEDICSPDDPGIRREPFLKSAPSRITQMSYDLLSCGVSVSRALYQKAGGLLEASPEARHAYNLRCLSRCSRPLHLSRPLYTLAQDRRPGLARLCGAQFALAKGEVASAGQWRGSIRVEHLQKTRPRAAIILPNLEDAQSLRRLLESIESQTLYPYSRILIADLGSRDTQTLRYYGILEKNRAARVLQGPGGSLSRLLNRAALEAGAEVLAFLGQDAEVLAPNWLEALIGQLYRPGVGAVGGKLVDCLGRIRYCGGVGGLGDAVNSFYEGIPDSLSSLRQNRFANSIREVSCLSLSCMALKAPVFWDAGGFNERLERAGLDIDLCLRLKQRRLACVYTPYALLRCHAPLPSLADAPPWDQRRIREALAAAGPDPHCSPHYALNQPVPLANPCPEAGQERDGQQNAAL